MKRLIQKKNLVLSKLLTPKENAMTKLQYLILSIVLITVTGCGTMGGAVSGAGQDLSRAGEWIRAR